MNIVFMGTPDFAVASLQALIDSNHTVSAVFTRADTMQNRGMKLTMPPVKLLAVAHDIPVFQPATLKNDEVLAILEGLAPDIIVVAAYGLILPKAILELPKHGCINVHASLLPKYRGASPINAAIIDGETKSGVTIMQMERGLDTGDMMVKHEVIIENDETYGSLHDKLAVIGGAALLEALEQIENGTVKLTKQDDELSCYAHMIKTGDNEVSFTDEADKVACKIRGYDPVPGAYGFLGEEKIKLFGAIYFDDSTQKNAGESIQCDKNGVLVQATNGTILIKDVQISGKKRMPAADCFRGRPQLLELRFK